MSSLASPPSHLPPEPRNQGPANEPAGAHACLDALRRRRDAGETLPAPELPLRLSGQRLLRCDLAGLDLSRADFSGADLSGSDLTGSQLMAARFDGATLHGAILEGVELLGACLKNAELTEARCAGAGFGGSDLTGARLISAVLDGATLTKATVKDADFRAASLRGTRLLELDLDGAVFDNADLHEADLSDCRVGRASFHGADLREARLRGMRDYRDADWVGADIRHADFCGAWLLRRHVLDENYLHEFRNQSPSHEWIYKVWWATSDCGRSVTRWAAWTALLCVVWAGLYSVVGGIDYGDSTSILDPLYFSVVTFTTLGYGDFLPVTTAAKLLVVGEVIFGYMALGGVLSILATKMGSRAG